MHPVLFHVGDFPIFTYGVVLALSFLLGGWAAVQIGRRRGYPGQFMADVTLWAIIMGLAGARLTFVLQNQDFFFAHPLQILNFREGGISIQGALLVGFSTVAWFFRPASLERYGMAPGPGTVANGLDVAAAPVLLGMASGRLGCVLHGCCYGTVTGASWGLVYPPEAGLGAMPRHPVQLYEMGLDLALVALVLSIFSRSRFAGQAFWSMIAGYGAIRFVTEFFREGALAGPVSPAQWLALLFVLVGVLGALGLYGRPPVSVARAEDQPPRAV